MPYYQERLKQSILKEVDSTSPKPLEKLNIVVNAGNGSGFYLNDVLRDLGANVDGSVHLTPDGSFPESFGVPNPEKREMIKDTVRACEAANADIGVLFDTE